VSRVTRAGSRRVRPLRVAFDMDGVFADLESALSRQAVALFGDAPDSAGRLPSSRRRRLWRRVQATENFWETLEEIEPGGVSRLAALAGERGWEVIFLTTRPETAGASAQTQTHRWLVERGFPCPSVFVVRRSRGAVAAALELDVVVDDRAENCLDVVSDSSARAVLTWRSAADVPEIALNRLRIDVVRGCNESLDLLTKIDSERQPRRSSFAMLLHALVPRTSRTA
jgi:hypothetical protein